MNETAIKVEMVSKTFRLPHEKYSTLKSSLIHFWGRKKGFEEQEVLKDISFEVKSGEFFGIIGKNGSGKSTLLKLMAGIYSPTHGEIAINGSLTPFIELGVGFNPELTGRENVYLNGALLGFNRKQMAKMYPGIVEFAELERFMDQKLKNYSSGMQVRLAFSIAIRAESSILLIDEVLAVGDIAFQQKCFRYFEKLKREKKTVIFITHDMETFEKYCDRGILIDKGEIIQSGDPYTTSAEYKILNMSFTPVVKEEPQLKFDHSIQKVLINGKDKLALKETEEMLIEIDIVAKENRPKTITGVSILSIAGIHIGFHNSRDEIGFIPMKKGQHYKFQYKLPLNELLPGAYYIDAAVYDEDNKFIDLKSQAATFAVAGNKITKHGLLNLKGKWFLKD